MHAFIVFSALYRGNRTEIILHQVVYGDRFWKSFFLPGESWLFELKIDEKI